MLKYARGKYRGSEAHIIIDREEARYFHVKTGSYLGFTPLRAVSARLLGGAFDCKVCSLILDKKTGSGDYAVFTALGRQDLITNITQDGLDSLVSRLKQVGLVCQFQHVLTDSVVEYIYIVKR